VRIHCTNITVSLLFQSIPVKSNGSAKAPGRDRGRCDVDLASAWAAPAGEPRVRLPENVPYRCRADNRPSQKMLDSDAPALPVSRGKTVA